MLQLTNISFDYAETPLLKHIQLRVLPGQLLHLQGENGSGKTTLLKLIAGLLIPTEGQIYFEEQCIVQHRTRYQREVRYIGHKMGMSSGLTPRENCYFDLHHQHASTDWMSSLKALSLDGLEDVPCGQLSAGQRRRVSLLRLYMSAAKLWLLDEPFVALDVKAVNFLRDKIMEQLGTGGSVILTSHQSLPFLQNDYIEYAL